MLNSTFQLNDEKKQTDEEQMNDEENNQQIITQLKTMWSLWGSVREDYILAKQLWRRMEDWLQTNVPQIYATLQPPVTTEQLYELLEQEKEVVGDHNLFPRSWLVTFAFHDGQTDVNRRAEALTGLIGGFKFYDFTSNGRLVDLESAAEDALSMYQQYRTALVPITKVIAILIELPCVCEPLVQTIC